jgi:hypothetical protein
MTQGTPSFIQLFGRSRYHRRIADDDNSAESNSVRLQRERFAAAAVGFCLKHSSAFRDLFWHRICRVEDDPPEAPQLRIEVEPAHWADLRLSALVAGQRFVWVIECKAGAPLEAKQNPQSPAFLQEGLGYGSLLKASEDGSKLRYTVLGVRSTSGDTPDENRESIIVRQLRWTRLLGGNVRDALVADLFDSLGKLGITCFRMSHIEKVRVSSGFEQAAAAWEVITILGSDDACGFRSSYWKIACGQPEAGNFYLGAYLKRPPAEKSTSPLHRELNSLLKPLKDKLIWVGYESSPQFRRSVWFYCGTRAASEAFGKKMMKRVPGATASYEEDEGWCAVISCPPSSKSADLAWFQGVIKASVA